MGTVTRRFILHLILMMIMVSTAQAGTDRIALILGLGSYEHITPLDNTRNDAEGLAETLDSIGFDVTLSLDATHQEMTDLLDDFAFRSEVADLALIYFAGHGVEVQGQNFLIPVDADPKTNLDVQNQSLSLDQLLEAVERARKMRIVILDSCRDNPLGGSIDLTQLSTQADGASPRASAGLAPANPDRGTLVAFAARDGQVALDGTRGNSPYARALMNKMVQPNLEISLMFRQVRDAVLRETGNLQEPHTYGSLSGTPFYLSGKVTQTAGADAANLAQQWSSIKPDQETQLLALAGLGDTRSMLGLAYIRLNPEDSRFSPSEAVDFLERAAANGSPEAQMELAKLLEQGLGVEQDLARALELYQAAADQGFADAINDLGFLHYHGGLGLKPSQSKALALFEKAAKLRHPEAQFNFAALIDDKLVPGQGPRQAAEYLYASLRSGNKNVLDLLVERPTMFTPETRRALQEELQQFDFYTGSIDGQFGAGTKRGLRAAYGLE